MKQLDKYPLEMQASAAIFELVSTGAKGAVRKVILFETTQFVGVYNLAFGDAAGEGFVIDDRVATNNGDAEIVPATVVEALYLFLNHHPSASVLATGSTPARTRLYRMGITKFLSAADEDFYVVGLTNRQFIPFQTGIDYDAFLVRLKRH